MKIFKTILLIVIIAIINSSCVDEDKSPLTLEENFTTLDLVKMERIAPLNGLINYNTPLDEVVIEVNITKAEPDGNIDFFTLQGDFYTDPQGNNLDLKVDFVTVTEFPANITLTLQEVLTALNKDVSDLNPGNLLQMHGASQSNGIFVNSETIGAGFADSDAITSGFYEPYKFHNILMIP